MSLDEERFVTQLCRPVCDYDDYWIVVLGRIIQNADLKAPIQEQLKISGNAVDVPRISMLFEIESNIFLSSDIRSEISTLQRHLTNLNLDVQKSGREVLKSADRLAMAYRQRQNLKQARLLLQRLVSDHESSNNLPAA